MAPYRRSFGIVQSCQACVVDRDLYLSPRSKRLSLTRFPQMTGGVQLMYNVHIMSESSVLTLRLDAKLKKRLDRLSKSMNRSRSFVAAEAIQEYVALNEWQIGEIKKAIAAADRGEFATDQQVEQALKRWTRRAR